MLLSVLLAVGCSPGTISLGEDVVDGEVLDPSLDTAEDTDGTDDGDPSTTDTGGSSGGGDTGGGDTGGGSTGGGGTGGSDTGGGSNGGGTGGGSTGGGSTGGGSTGGGSTGGGTTDTVSGTYTGVVEGSLDVGRGDIGCTGTVSFAVDASGNVSGSANCLISDWGLDLAGSLTGTVVGGSLDATWNIDLRGYLVPNALRGTVSGGVAEMRFEDSVSWADFSGAMAARR